MAILVSITAEAADAYAHDTTELLSSAVIDRWLEASKKIPLGSLRVEKFITSDTTRVTIPVGTLLI